MMEDFRKEYMKDEKVIIDKELIKELGFDQGDKMSNTTLLDEIVKITDKKIKDDIQKMKEDLRTRCTDNVYSYAEKGYSRVYCIFENLFYDFDRYYRKIFEDEIEYWCDQGFYAEMITRDIDVRRVEIKISWEDALNKLENINYKGEK